VALAVITDRPGSTGVATPIAAVMSAPSRMTVRPGTWLLRTTISSLHQPRLEGLGGAGAGVGFLRAACWCRVSARTEKSSPHADASIPPFS
jgi:hypothetical protein